MAPVTPVWGAALRPAAAAGVVLLCLHWPVLLLLLVVVVVLLMLVRWLVMRVLAAAACTAACTHWRRRPTARGGGCRAGPCFAGWCWRGRGSDTSCPVTSTCCCWRGPRRWAAPAPCCCLLLLEHLEVQLLQLRPIPHGTCILADVVPQLLAHRGVCGAALLVYVAPNGHDVLFGA
jgi:hypothetical protein